MENNPLNPEPTDICAHLPKSPIRKCLLQAQTQTQNTISPTLLPLDANSTLNPEEQNIFSPSIFWQTHSNYASQFVEYLGTDCFHFCPIPVKLSDVSCIEYKSLPTESTQK
jgi:hypothetical protein